jgi:hypothetical protein
LENISFISILSFVILAEFPSTELFGVGDNNKLLFFATVWELKGWILLVFKSTHSFA